MLLKKVIKRLSREFVLKNVKKISTTSEQKRALLCYYVFPFLLSPQKQHTNELEVKGIAEALAFLGYIVDVVDYRYRRSINYDIYDVIIGLGNVFERAFFYEGNAKKIFFATGSHPYFSSTNEVERIKEFRKRTNKWIAPTRLRSLPEYECATRLSDGIICLGNEITKKTYNGINTTVKMQNAIANVRDELSVAKKKKNKFIWFGSTGLVHKGLDITIEAFLDEALAECELVIYCVHEHAFFSCYNDVLKNRKNISYKGFRSLNDEELIKDLEESQWCILLSCSEGQSTSLLTAMSYGCIPIASAYVGLQESLYSVQSDICVESLVSTIKAVLEIKPDKLIDIMESNHKTVCDENSYETFVASSQKNIYEIISNV